MEGLLASARKGRYRDVLSTGQCAVLCGSGCYVMSLSTVSSMDYA
jgi:hypothetical protein